MRHVWYGDWAIGDAKSAATLFRFAEEVLAISREHDLALPFAFANIARGWCLGVMGRPSEAVAQVQEAVSKFPKGAKLGVPFHLLVLADLYGKVGQTEEGLQRLAEAAELAEMTKERWAEAEMHRLRGTLLLSVEKCDAAEESFNTALAVARQQSAKFWELRAATSLASLWADQDKPLQARELLGRVWLVYRRLRHSCSERSRGAA